MNNENSKQNNGMEEILSMLGELPYPKEFLDKYDIIRLLAQKNGTETFLAKGKSDSGKYIVKCYDSSMSAFTHENELLNGLSHQGLPVYVDCYSNDRVLISVREYVEGKPLDLFAVSHSLSENQAVSLICQLCDILSYLHSRSEPIIHRDIKPNNIIVKPDGSIVLIDFDIARKYRDQAERDTGLLATPGYAPPEQYGFSQTDTRSDIYSMGVLLRWLLTGDEKPTGNDGVSSGLKSIIDKCTAFSPEDRYDSAEEVKTALLSYKNSGRRSARTAKYIFIPLLCLIALGAGYMLTRNTEKLPMPWKTSAAVSGTDGTGTESSYVSDTAADAGTTGNDEETAKDIVFKEPLIERSVRMQVGKTNGEELTEDDLLSVTGIYIDGVNAFATYDEAGSHIFDGEWGDISTLEDVKLLPKAWDVIVKHQTLSDISGLENSYNISNLWLDNVFVYDCSVLRTMPALESVLITNAPVNDLTVFDHLPRLRDVYADGKVPLEKIGGRDTVRLLGLNGRYFDSFEGLIGFDKLETLCIDYEVTVNCSFEPLRELPSLRVINTNSELADELEKTFKGTDVEIKVN